MGLLEVFHQTWSQARETFGQGTPEDGAKFDGSSRLMQMKASVEAAAPDSRWQGTASEAYAAANRDHAQVYGKLADLDKRMAAEVTNAANVVTTGDPDVTYPRHDGDGPGKMSNERVLPGDRGALPDGVQSALNAKLDLSGPSALELGKGLPTPFGETAGGKGLVDLSTIIGDGSPRFQQGSELDRGLMSRGQEILGAADRHSWGDTVVERIFESAGRHAFDRCARYGRSSPGHAWRRDRYGVTRIQGIRQ